MAWCDCTDKLCCLNVVSNILHQKILGFSYSIATGCVFWYPFIINSEEDASILSSTHVDFAYH